MQTPTPLKIFNEWYNYIFGETELSHDGTIDGARGKQLQNQ